MPEIGCGRFFDRALYMPHPDSSSLDTEGVDLVIFGGFRGDVQTTHDYFADSEIFKLSLKIGQASQSA